MGFCVTYRSTRPVTSAEADAICRASDAACLGRTWLSCEPVYFDSDREEGRLLGSSKLNFSPDPEEAAEAAESGLPDGTVLTVLDILTALSRDHAVDWEIDHDEAPEPIGWIKAGHCDDAVRTQIEALAEFSRAIAELDPDDFGDE